MAYFQKVPAKNKQGYKWKCTEDAPLHPVTGKRRQVTRRADSKKEAQQKVMAAIEEIKKKDRGEINTDLENITVKELFEKWFELIMKRKLKETTFKEYYNAANYRIIPVLGSIRVKDLNTIMLQKYINDLIDEGLSPRYIEYISTIFYGALETARKWKVIQTNPLIDVEKPRPRRIEYITWTLDEMNRFLHLTKLSNLRLFTIVSTATKTGLRRGEILSLKWSDVDFENKTICVERSLVYDKNGFRFTTPKTSSSNRVIKIGDSLIRDFKRWKTNQNEIKMVLRKSYEDHDLIFSTQTGKPIFPRSLTHDFNKAIKVAGVPKIRFHDLRHTHATICLEAGMSLKEVQDRLGHSSIKTTGDVYAHVTDAMKEKTVDLFEKYISK
ncbi:tyrosine-type recombinase/integrase [Bacillus chungangensis]|uniref:Integrase n=1 Tax=Bacillus chungangensis TaxID=587633 RepID=A0ABT9WRW4_9BACI|nr:tyrosine-type recombinase/integrase [Bacillus chungangensis]MDQ0176046.1 integrase [Bacillus chungangensis]